VPSPEDPNVIYFGPGIHQAGLIKLASHQTLYLDGGSVVKGAIESHGVDITTGGRGILLGDDWPWLKGPAGYMAGFAGCQNVTMRDVIPQGSWGWTIVLKGCRSVTILESTAMRRPTAGEQKGLAGSRENGIREPCPGLDNPLADFGLTTEEFDCEN
jgi:hypothetical protein